MGEGKSSVRILKMICMSRELLLQRRYFKDTYTIGKLSVDDAPCCDTLEDRVRDYNMDGDLLDEGEEKIYGDTAIPYGRYRVIVSYSPKFKRELPLLLSVPHFEGIRIHAGNSAKDSSGCILVGENKIKGGLINSRLYERELTTWLQMWQGMGEDIWINIV